MPSDVAARVHIAISGRTFPGCVIGVSRGGVREIRAFGSLTYDGNEPAVADTVYDLASVTKSIPAASLALTLIAEKKMSLDDAVKMHVPELHNDYGATIEDLLRYRVRGVQLSKLRRSTFEEIRTAVLESGFDGPPGASVYTNLPAYVLGLVIERVTGSSIAVLAHRYFFEPLGMHHTSFFPSAPACAPTEIDLPAQAGGRGEVRGMPHDESAFVFAKARRSCAHAGLFSSAADVLVFLEALLAGRMPEVLRGAEAGLGWQVNDARFMGLRARGKTFGKTGFTGTSVLADSERGIALVILSNRTYPKRPANDDAIFSFRADIADIILA